MIQKLLLLPELDKSGDITENVKDKLSGADTFREVVPTSLQLTKHDSLDNLCGYGVRAKPALYFNRKVVVDHLTASWSLVRDP